MTLQGIPQNRVVVLDTETTGFSPKSDDRLIEIAGVELINGRLTGRSVYGLFWPERDVPARAAQVHGWTTAKLRGKPLFASQAAELADFFDGAELWAHNAAFDARFVTAEMERAGIRRPFALSCSVKLAKKHLPHFASHKLEHLAAWANHTWTGAAHGAMADTLALTSVLQKLWAMGPASTPAKTSGKTQALPSAPKAVPGPALADWTGPVAPGNDPRVAHITWSGPLPGQGTPWTGEEDGRLRAAFLDGASLVEMVRAHGRSPAALALRLERQGLVAGDHPYGAARWRR